MGLTEDIAQVLARYDPLRAADNGGVAGAYGVEADELAELLAGASLGPAECASVCWAVIATSVGVQSAGALHNYGMIGAELAAVIAGAGAITHPASDDEAAEPVLDLPSDPFAVAVLAILDDRDPARVGDDPQRSFDDELRYAAAAEEIALRLVDLPVSIDACARLAHSTLERLVGPCAATRVAAVGADLAELAALAEYVRAELAAIEHPSPLPAAHPPADPFCAGVLALLSRYDPAGHDNCPGAYLTEAEELVELLRLCEPDSVHCGAVAWAVVKRWSRPGQPLDSDACVALGADIAHLVELYRELSASNPDLLQPSVTDAAVRLGHDQLALRVHELLLNHDPFGLVETSGPTTTDYVPYARELALRLVDGSPNAGFCQVLAWKVLTEPWGGLGGSIGRFRDLGRDLHMLAAV